MKDCIPIYIPRKRLLIPRSQNEMNLINKYIKYDANEAKYKHVN